MHILWRELYDLNQSSTIPINEDYIYSCAVQIGTMTSGVDKSALMTSLPSEHYVYVGSGAMGGGSQFVMLWRFTRNGTVYESRGFEEIYTQGSAG